MIRSIFVVVICTCSATPALAQKKLSAAADDPRRLSLEVVALQTLQRLDLTGPQLEALLRVSKGAASNLPAKDGSKVSSAFLKSLQALRSALLAGDDDEIDACKDKLHEIMDKERIVLDDHVPISDAARRTAPQLVRALTPAQLLAFMQTLDDDDVDPLDVLESALERAKGDAGSWKSIRDNAASDAAWLLAGSDEAKARPVAQALAILLDQQRSPGKAKTPMPDLAQQMKMLIAQVHPLQIVNNAVERDVAELLSNPCLPAAIQHTIDQRAKTKSVRR